MLGQAGPRLVFATDPESAERVLRLAAGGRLGEATVVAEGLPRRSACSRWRRLLDLGSILDTAERAQGFRAVSRQVDPRSEACGMPVREGLARLTHGDAMQRVEPWLRARPAAEGDVAYLGGPRVDLATRLALAGLRGRRPHDDRPGREARTDKDVASFGPHKMVLSGRVARDLLPGAWAALARGARRPGLAVGSSSASAAGSAGSRRPRRSATRPPGPSTPLA